MVESRDPFLRVSVSKFSVLYHKCFVLGAWNTATICFIKTSVFTCFLFAVLAGKKQPKQIRKMSEIRKIFNFCVMITFFEKFKKNFGIIHESSSTESRSRISSLETRIF